jgi:hypothetical protein
MLQEVFGDETMSCVRTYELHRRVTDNRTSTERLSKFGRPSTPTDGNSNEQGPAVTCSNRLLTIWKIADECIISGGMCHTTLTE